MGMKIADREEFEKCNVCKQVIIRTLTSKNKPSFSGGFNVIFLYKALYSGSVVKTKIRVFYNELIRLISYKEQGEDIGALP